jgi:A/G-specific adenine glycosylase
MLQQTQAHVVNPCYSRFLARFPDMRSLAAAGEDDVLKLWEGLGYYRRIHHFITAVKEVCLICRHYSPCLKNFLFFYAGVEK